MGKMTLSEGVEAGRGISAIAPIAPTRAVISAIAGPSRIAGATWSLVIEARRSALRAADTLESRLLEVELETGLVGARRVHRLSPSGVRFEQRRTVAL